MPKSNIVKTLDDLSKTDTYSIILFAIWLLHKEDEYSTLSELPYVLEGDNLIRFLKYYGGKTITIPTMDEFKKIINALTLYQEVNLENNDYDETLKAFKKEEVNVKELANDYAFICNLLKDYDFRRN